MECKFEIIEFVECLENKLQNSLAGNNIEMSTETCTLSN